jgi:hypothetical protein
VPCKTGSENEPEATLINFSWIFLDFLTVISSDRPKLKHATLQLLKENLNVPAIDLPAHIGL